MTSLNSCVVGVDPGLQGALVALGNNNDLEFLKMPTTKNSKGKTEYNIKLIVDFLRNKSIRGVAVELVHARPGQGVSSMFTMGRGLGILEGIIVALELPYIKVAPQTWQKEILRDFNRGDDAKTASIINAERMFPQVTFMASERCTKVDNNLTDATNIALFAKKTFI